MIRLTSMLFEGRTGGAVGPVATGVSLVVSSPQTLLLPPFRGPVAVGAFGNVSHSDLLITPQGFGGGGLGEGVSGLRPLAPSLKNSPSANPGKRPAVFLDRDGTINEEMGYINHLSRFCLLPEAAPAIRRLNEAGLPVVVVTNQSGAARGYFPATLVDEVHRHLHDLLAHAGARVDAIYACLHGPEAGCSCRKPQPGLLLTAAQDLNLDLTRSYLVGDRYKDIETAANAGVAGILVLTGYGRGEYEQFHEQSQPRPVHVAEGLLDAVDFILAQHMKEAQ